MKILGVIVENIKRLSVVHVTPDGSPVIVIGGENGAGKSSLIDAMQMALGGEKAIPSKPVRTGEPRGRIVIDLGDIIVTRIISAGGSTSLKVTSRDGKATYSSPQALLDGLIGKLSFDPAAFSEMKPKDQMETLRALVGLDTSDLDKAAADVYAERSTVNKGVKQLEGQLAGMPVYPIAQCDEVSIAALTEELAAAEATQATLATARAAYEKAAREHKAAQDSLAEDERKAASLREQLATAEARVTAGQSVVAGKAQAVSVATTAGLTAKNALIESAPIRDRINAAESVNVQVRANIARVKAQAFIDQEKSAADAHSRSLLQLADDKAKRIAEAVFPIPGLGLTESGITFNGEPFEQASEAERIRVSVGIGFALNPKLKVLWVRHGSGIGRKNLALIAELAQAANGQVFLEKMTETAEGVQVFIEDGTVKQDVSAVA